MRSIPRSIFPAAMPLNVSTYARLHRGAFSISGMVMHAFRFRYNRTTASYYDY